VIRYLDLAEYLWLAEQVSGIEAAVLAKASRVELADSALHAPSAGFGDVEFYPDIYDEGCRPRVPPGVEPSTAGRQQARRVGITRDVDRVERRRLGAGSSRRRRRRTPHARDRRR
jgi:death-on-curing protein